MQVIDLKGELANSKAGQAAIKQAVDTAAKEHAASIAREKSLKVYVGAASCPLSARNIKLPKNQSCHVVQSSWTTYICNVFFLKPMAYM
jgi:hypothetical protein